MEVTKEARDKFYMQALQSLNAGANPLDVMRNIQEQGVSESDAKEIARDALLEARKDLYKQGATIFGLLKVATPIILVVTVALSAILTPFIGVPVGLIGGVVTLVYLSKKKMQQ